jgi:2-hydroxy-3-keto-5-methylthiopentenyl-1-phosphate phosphatase
MADGIPRLLGFVHPPSLPRPVARMFLDFDGTLVEPNVAIILVEEFCPDGQRLAHEVDEELHSGRITLRQAWERQAALLPADRLPEMIDFALKNAPLRGGAQELIRLLQKHRVPITVVSGGLDFYIRPVLEREGFDLPVLSDTAEATPSGFLRVLHPHGHATCRLCGICKAQAIRRVEPGADHTIFAGDGSTDKFAAEVADIVFARRRLRTYCETEGIPHYPFDEFPPVTVQMRRWLEGGEPFPRPRQVGRLASECPISLDLALQAAT